MRSSVLKRIMDQVAFRNQATREKMTAVLMGASPLSTGFEDEDCYVWIALGAIPEAVDIIRAPLLVMVPRHHHRCQCDYCEIHKRKLKDSSLDNDVLRTEDVARFFVSRAAGLGESDETRPTWAPAARSSFAYRPIGGDLDSPVGDGEDVECPSNWYDYYDLSAVPPSGTVYRVSSTKTLWAFNRRSDGFWRVVVFENYEWAKTAYEHDLGSLIQGALIADDVSSDDD